MKIKKLSALLICLLVLTSITGCGKDKESMGNDAHIRNDVNDIDAKEVDNTEPVKILSAITGGKDPDEHVLWQKEIERVLGIKVDITKIANEYVTKLTATLASGDDMDIVYMNSGQFEKLFKTGLFEPLTKYIENSPILSDPDVVDSKEWERIRREDGEIYAVFNKYEGGRMPLIRRDWLEKLGLEEPNTLEEYYEVFKAFTHNDPDGNNKNDTYGLTLKAIYDIQPFMSAYGLFDGEAQDENGKWYIPWATEEAVPVYDWLAKLYDEGLLDPNFATNTSSACREMILSNRAGMFVYWDNWVGLFNSKVRSKEPDNPFEIKGLPPILDENGNGVLTSGQDGLWVMLKTSKNKDQAFRFLESAFYTREGIIINTLGIEGHDYNIENGKYVLTETGEQHAMDHGIVVPKTLNYESPMPQPLNYEEARDIVIKYGKSEILRDTTKDAKEIIKKHAIQAILGVVNGEKAVKDMQKELKAKKFID
ncbi:extracellular solute-binding protein [Vallitalea guaymasensis]|uniref:extracellular solute-binding protein n=1 Tax=Vallitalea guaymasensis TaxID=1185412 RepID=UPI00272BFDDB|nr:extracellular solute-binding protein [Vallitalea guaymasensis]